MAAAIAFFAQARESVEHRLKRVVTDGLSSYPRAIKEALGEEVDYDDNPQAGLNVVEHRQ